MLQLSSDWFPHRLEEETLTGSICTPAGSLPTLVVSLHTGPRDWTSCVARAFLDYAMSLCVISFLEASEVYCEVAGLHMAALCSFSLLACFAHIIVQKLM